MIRYSTEHYRKAEETLGVTVIVRLAEEGLETVRFDLEDSQFRQIAEATEGHKGVV